MIAVVAAEVLEYVAFVANVPFALSLGAMVAAIVIVLQDTYALKPLRFMYALPFAGSRIPEHFSVHLDLKQFLTLYAQISFFLFVIWEVVSLVLHLKRASFQRRFAIAAIVATLGWGFVIAHVPFMRVANQSSRVSLALAFFFLYVLGLAGFAFGLLIARASTAVIDRIVGTPPLEDDRGSNRP